MDMFIASEFQAEDGSRGSEPRLEFVFEYFASEGYSSTDSDPDVAASAKRSHITRVYIRVSFLPIHTYITALGTLTRILFLSLVLRLPRQILLMVLLRNMLHRLLLELLHSPLLLISLDVRLTRTRQGLVPPGSVVHGLVLVFAFEVALFRALERERRTAGSLSDIWEPVPTKRRPPMASLLEVEIKVDLAKRMFSIAIYSGWC
ncbi:hypothetical protein G7K_6888-t1 [Saitoella complicata NRRL Y-17804]|uniref:Uncharacterized protein n=1 Tax=Saitoella complicata (strain BCRC 22490 / CBS 7301 / JCM 7358 / NBRC 10748 / NRRL Y-17804) TaxID=698492 RepID=A0A0E9NT09_SAICN|nr:hypothetical protein G7K_6888-t1 [Saitoella complicata NRRL Y-17804]